MALKEFKNKEIKDTASGEPILDEEKKPWNIKRIIIRALNNHMTLKAEDSIRVYEIALDLNSHEEVIRLNDDDLAFVKKILEEGLVDQRTGKAIPFFPATMMGVVFKAMKEAEKAEKPKPKT